MRQLVPWHSEEALLWPQDINCMWSKLQQPGGYMHIQVRIKMLAPKMHRPLRFHGAALTQGGGGGGDEHAG